MKKYCTFLVVLFAIHASAQINQGALITKENILEIPFFGTKDEIHTKASIRGDEYDFMLDTGAPVFISSALQKKYKFPILHKGKTQDATGNKVKTEIVMIDTIRIGPFIFTGIPAIVINMKESPIECINLPGNFGSNLLRHLYVRFDINEHKITITDNKKLFKRSALTALPMHVDRQSDVYFPVKLNNELIDTIHFDSGDGQMYSMSTPVMTKYIAHYPEHVVREGYGQLFMGIGGTGRPTPQYIVKPTTITVGNNATAGGTVNIAGNDRSRMGRELLNYGILQLNYPDSNYSFEKYTSENIPTHADFGFQAVMDGDDIVVGCVWKNTAAERLGLQAGDHILMIDGQDISTMTKCEATITSRDVNYLDKITISLTFRHPKQKSQTITLEKKSL